jgi:hypothetical protein
MKDTKRDPARDYLDGLMLDSINLLLRAVSSLGCNVEWHRDREDLLRKVRVAGKRIKARSLRFQKVKESNDGQNDKQEIKCS